MICPACKSGLYKKRLQGLEVVICCECQGVWLDEKTLKKTIDQIICTEDIKPSNTYVSIEQRNIIILDKLKNIRICPQCSGAMAKLNYAYNSNIILDKCKSCGGIWTDKGKLKAIAEYSKGDPGLAEIRKNLIKNKGRICWSEFAENGIDSLDVVLALAEFMTWWI